MTNSNVNRLVKLSALAAISIVLVSLIHFPIFPMISFIEYDMGDVPILIGALAYGPWWGLALTVITALVQGLTVSASSGVIGIIMHILSTGVGVLTASLIYQHHKSKKGATLALVAFVPAITATMLLCNYFLTPLFLISDTLPYAAAQEIVVGLMGWIALMNFTKSLINATLIYFLYKPMSRYFLKKEFTLLHEK